MTYRRPAAGLAALALATLGASAAPAQTTEITVVVPNPSAITFLPLHVAIGEGYFEEEGLDVSVEAVNGSAAVLQTMASGQAEIGAPGPGPLLAARARDENFVFIYNLYPRSLFGLVVPEESDVQEPAGLEGTTVGVGTADGAEVAFARGILNDAGLTEDEDYEFLPIGDGGTAAAAFLRDEVSGYSAGVPDWVIIEERGIPLREITPEEYLGYFGNGWATTADYIESNPDVIEGFGRAMVRGTEFAMDEANTETVLEHTAANNPQEAEDPEFAQALLDATRERMTPVDQNQAWGFQPPEDWEKWQQSLVETGALEAPLDDLEAAYTNEFVETWNEGS